MTANMDTFIRQIVLGTLEKHGVRISSRNIDYNYTPGEDDKGVFLDVQVILHLHAVDYNCGVWRIRKGAITSFAPPRTEILEDTSLDWAVSLAKQVQSITRTDNLFIGNFKGILSLLQCFIDQIHSIEVLISDNNSLAIAISSVFEAADWHKRIGSTYFEPSSLSIFEVRKAQLRRKLNERWFWKETAILSKLCKAFPGAEGRSKVTVEDVNFAFDFYESILYKIYTINRLLQPKNDRTKEYIFLDNLAKSRDIPPTKIMRLFEHWGYLHTEDKPENITEVIVDSILHFSLVLYSYYQYLKFRQVTSDEEMQVRIRSAFGIDIGDGKDA